MSIEAISAVIKQGLMPEFIVEGRLVVMATPQIAGIAVRHIGEVVMNVEDRHHDVRRALDILTGDF